MGLLENGRRDFLSGVTLKSRDYSQNHADIVLLFEK